MGSLLHGAANIWYTEYIQQGANQAKTWGQLKDDFIREFSSEQPLRKLKFRLNIRKQGDTEDIKNYYCDMITLTNEVDPNMPFENFRDFENGLHPSYYETYYLMSGATTNNN